MPQEPPPDERPTPARPDLSVVVPVRNEEESVPVLAGEIARALDGAGLSWECLWIDDGSTDGSAAVLGRLEVDDPRHRTLRLARHYGQSAALAAGFRAARAAVVGTLDADLQNDPADLPRLFTLLAESGAGMIQGVRTRRRDGRIRRWSSRIANRFRNLLTGERIRDVGCALRVFRAEYARGIPTFRGMHRFLPTLLRLRGCEVREVPVRHRPRLHGRTKYGIHNRLWVGILDSFGVWWLKRRWVEPHVIAAGAERAPPPTSRPEDVHAE